MSSSRKLSKGQKKVLKRLKKTLYANSAIKAKIRKIRGIKSVSGLMFVAVLSKPFTEKQTINLTTKLFKDEDFHEETEHYVKKVGLPLAPKNKYAKADSKDQPLYYTFLFSTRKPSSKSKNAKDLKGKKKLTLKEAKKAFSAAKTISELKKIALSVN